MTAPYGLKRGWPSRLQSKTAIGRYRLADAHAIVAGERAEAALEALADSAEFPFGAVAIDFAEDHRGFGRSVFRSEAHTSELQSLMSISYAVFCLKKKKHNNYRKNIRTN